MTTEALAIAPAADVSPAPETRCGECGTPLTEYGLVDLALLGKVTTDRDQMRALRDERMEIEQRLARAALELETAKRLKDEPRRARAAEAVERKQARLDEVDRILAGSAVPEPRVDGPCIACKTPFRNGRVDRAAAARAISEDTDRRANLAALERELRYTHAGVALEQRSAELAVAKDERAEAGAHRDRADHAAKRIPLIEAAITRTRKELHGHKVGASRSRK